jgi:predicted DNA-binding ribbon-helix-helix protein
MIKAITRRLYDNRSYSDSVKKFSDPDQVSKSINVYKTTSSNPITNPYLDQIKRAISTIIEQANEAFSERDITLPQYISIITLPWAYVNKRLVRDALRIMGDVSFPNPSKHHISDSIGNRVFRFKKLLIPSSTKRIYTDERETIKSVENNDTDTVEFKASLNSNILILEYGETTYRTFHIGIYLDRLHCDKTIQCMLYYIVFIIENFSATDDNGMNEENVRGILLSIYIFFDILSGIILYIITNNKSDCLDSIKQIITKFSMLKSKFDEFSRSISADVKNLMLMSQFRRYLTMCICVFGDGFVDYDIIKQLYYDILNNIGFTAQDDILQVVSLVDSLDQRRNMINNLSKFLFFECIDKLKLSTNIEEQTQIIHQYNSKFNEMEQDYGDIVEVFIARMELIMEDPQTISYTDFFGEEFEQKVKTYLLDKPESDKVGKASFGGRSTRNPKKSKKIQRKLTKYKKPTHIKRRTYKN